MNPSSIKIDQSKIIEEVKKECQSITSENEINLLKKKYFGKKGMINDYSKLIKTASKEKKKSIGKLINDLKNKILFVVNEKENELSHKTKKIVNQIQIDLPGRIRQIGLSHPLYQVQQEISQILNKIGFITVEGPEIETEYYNFEALNIPKDHPARNEQDSLYLKEHFLLRTQTSPVQIRIMEQMKPPIAIISPGKVYRRDSIDSKHTPIFHQIEGLFIDKDVSFNHLKATLSFLCREIFGNDIEIRFRPDYFPFTEPSCEISILFKGEWLEILGAGLVNPLLFDKVDIDKDQYSGFAFGLGVERIAMIKYDIKDIRLFYENDYKFLKQFE